MAGYRNLKICVHLCLRGQTACSRSFFSCSNDNGGACLLGICSNALLRQCLHSCINGTTSVCKAMVFGTKNWETQAGHSLESDVHQGSCAGVRCFVLATDLLAYRSMSWILDLMSIDWKTQLTVFLFMFLQLPTRRYHGLLHSQIGDSKPLTVFFVTELENLQSCQCSVQIHHNRKRRLVPLYHKHYNTTSTRISCYKSAAVSRQIH